MYLGELEAACCVPVEYRKHLRLRFIHERSDLADIPARTIAQIVSRVSPDSPGRYVFAEGTACCSLKDQYCKETGRRIAILRMHASTACQPGLRPLTGAALAVYFARKRND